MICVCGMLQNLLPLLLSAYFSLGYPLFGLSVPAERIFMHSSVVTPVKKLEFFEGHSPLTGVNKAVAWIYIPGSNIS